ncbi:MAG TPA: hypothetical protein VI636_09370 [Candidatus Angelobacter sp.]
MAYEPQSILISKNVALAANKQNTYLTPVAASAYVSRPRSPGTSFASITPTFYSDEQQSNKGHQFPTTKQRTMQATAFDATWDLDNFLSGWVFAFAMGADTVTGAGPYTHLFKFLQSTNQMPVTSLLHQDTNDVIYQLPDMVINDLQITGKESGPLQAQFKMVGSGKNVDGAVTLPAVTTPAFVFGSDADILIGPGAPDPTLFTIATQAGGTQAARTEYFKFTYTSAAGETLASGEVSIAVPLNSVSKVTAPAAFPPGVTSCSVYASTATGTETKQQAGIAAAGTYTEPNTGFTAGTALPTATSALTSIKERVKQWVVHLVMDMQPNRAPGGGFFSTFTKVLKQRANLQLQIAAKDVDDLRTLFVNDTPRNIQIKANSGAAQQLILDYPYVMPVCPAGTASGVEIIWPLTAGDQDVLKWQGQEIFTATVVNNVASYLTGA